jgi:transcriptional regulator with XRE-family HTH domain
MTNKGGIMTFGYKLREAREGCKLTVSEAARLAGITHSAVSQFENDKKSPSLGTLNRLADIYGVSLPFFLDDIEEPLIQTVYRSEDKYKPDFSEEDKTILAEVRTIVRNLFDMHQLSEHK